MEAAAKNIGPASQTRDAVAEVRLSSRARDVSRPTRPQSQLKQHEVVLLSQRGFQPPLRDARTLRPFAFQHTTVNQIGDCLANRRPADSVLGCDGRGGISRSITLRLLLELVRTSSTLRFLQPVIPPAADNAALVWCQVTTAIALRWRWGHFHRAPQGL